MSDSGSYKLKSFSTDTEGEIRRLKGQVELFWEREFELYRSLGLRDGCDLLECGCGPGYMIGKIADAFPSCRATGLEIDPTLVEVAREEAAKGGRNRFAVVQASILETGLPSSAFDFVFARLVIEHLPDPGAAVEEIMRILKPNGRAVLLDNDFDMHLQTYPRIPELDALYDAYCRSREATGGRPRIGRELPWLLDGAGFADIAMDVVAAHSYRTGDDAFLQSEGVGISSQLVKDGFLDKGILDRIAEKWRALFDDPMHSFYRQVFVASGRKPAVGESEPARKIVDRHHSKRMDAVVSPKAANDDPEDITLAVQRIIASALGKEAQAIPVDAPLSDIGFDSLAAVDTRTGIKSLWAVELSVADFFEGQTAGDIASLVAAKLKQRGPARDGAPDRPSTGWDEGVL